MAAEARSMSSYFASHPTGFWFFFWGEFAERCSYYGMRAILAKYMAEQLGLGEANAATYMSFFIAACYFLPLLGGWIADNFFGKYWTIVGFCVPYIAGHFILGVEDFTYMLVALTLLAMGSGVIKPNISTLMGLTYDQQRPGKTQLRSDAFAIFYFSINVGAALSQFALPPLRSAYGYAIAFAFPALLMVISFVIFALGKPYYAVETISRKKLTPEERAAQWTVLGRIVGLFALVMFFWAIFDQSASTWIFFANACMNLTMFGVEVDPDQIQGFNPVFILIFLPLVTIGVRGLINRGWNIRPTDKMMAGFILTAVCMSIMALAAALAGQADLRPALVTQASVKPGEEAPPLTLSFATSEKKVSITGDLRISVVGANTVAISGKKATLVNGEKTTEFGAEDKLKLTAAEEIILHPENGEFTALGGPLKLVYTAKEKDPLTLIEGEKPTITGKDLDVTTRWFVSPKNQVSVWWQVFAYLIITIAEILISVTGLELAYTLAPPSMTGFVTACWLATVGFANLVINAPVTRLYTTMQPMLYFAMLAAVIIAVSIAFHFVARQFNQNDKQVTPAA